MRKRLDINKLFTGLVVVAAIAIAVDRVYPVTALLEIATGNPEGSCLIKGNISKSGERIYHVPGGEWYGATQIDRLSGERWFCSEHEAIAAGWRRAYR